MAVVVVAVAVAALSALSPADAWSAVAYSSFGGAVLSASSSSRGTNPASSSAAVLVQNGATMVMKKGKPNVPVQMRGQYRRQQEMASMQREMIAATQATDDGLPVFNLFVRTKRQNVSLVVVCCCAVVAAAAAIVVCAVVVGGGGG